LTGGPILSDEHLLARLIGFDTTSRHSNLPLVDFLCDYLDRPGIRLTRITSPDQSKANLIVELGPSTTAETRSGLVLSGHMDVVPAEPDDWTSDPFELCMKDRRYYGRGTADMKGFVALAVNLAARLATSELQAPLVLLLTYDEELGTLGAEHLCHSWPATSPLPRNAVIGEPTSLRVIRSHKGYLKMRFTLRGLSAHSAYPHLGRSAIEPGGRLIVALAELREQLERERQPSSADFPDVPFASLNLGLASGGTAINVVPDRFTLEAGLRLLPGMDGRQCAERLERAARDATAGEKLEVEMLGISPPMSLDSSAAFLQRLYRLLGQAPADGVAYATDAGWLQSMGMDCVLFGPGSIAVAHKPDEFLPADEFEEAALLLQRVVDEYCGQPG
jgi:acetylornithine deacetylase